MVRIQTFSDLDAEFHVVQVVGIVVLTTAGPMEFAVVTHACHASGSYETEIDHLGINS